jgi:SAM-dependent methyltransferase
MDFIVCPRCRGDLTLEVFSEEAVPLWSSTGAEIHEGALHCTNCAAAFPVVDGVPRLLAADLLAILAPRYPHFFADHPAFLHGSVTADARIAATLESFTRQRLDLGPPSAEFASQWREHLQRNLGSAMSLCDLRGKLILDVGCGFGRHMYVANEAGAETVGIDLSGGVDVAVRNNANHPHCHVVQGNIFDRPLRDEKFDVVWSFGVLHHLPDPRRGFEAIVPFAKPDGLVVIWVYGYRGMAFTYKLSHMRPLHRMVRRMSGRARVRASKIVAAILSVLYWEPLRLAKRLGFRRVVERVPLASYVDHPWLPRVAAVHDRLSTPITHFHDHDELQEWFAASGLGQVRVEDTQRRGWRAHGERRAIAKQQRA